MVQVPPLRRVFGGEVLVLPLRMVFPGAYSRTSEMAGWSPLGIGGEEEM